MQCDPMIQQSLKDLMAAGHLSFFFASVNFIILVLLLVTINRKVDAIKAVTVPKKGKTL